VGGGQLERGEAWAGPACSPGWERSGGRPDSSETSRRSIPRRRRLPLPAAFAALSISAWKRARIGAAHDGSLPGSSRATTSSTPAGSNIGDR